ncbi:MAG TPA: uroporphyrinogen-III synthase, partial [Xanthobacteraceae bacterium]|nr:uroporphyrinogen-III synthase [Xanthobacteraceae bacterium]
MRLLLTRPEPDAQRTAAALRERGHTVIVAPLMRVEILANAEIGAGPWAAILVTSANAAHAIAAHRRKKALESVPVFAVGERSAQAMRDAGFADVSSADGGVGDLAQLVGERMTAGSLLLYLAGAERAGDLAAKLATRRLAVHTAVVYRAVAVDGLPPAASDALARDIEGVLHYSRRTAEAYVNAARAVGILESALKPAQFCLSAQIAEPLAQAGASIIHVARRPIEAALI